MMLKSVAKRLALLVLGSAGRLDRRLARITSASALTILNFHRVSRDDGSAYKPIKPRLFEDLLVFLIERFEIVTFADLPRAPASGRPHLVISFDDGYKDFVEVVAPILDKYRVRVNQNVVPECVETGKPPLNIMAQDFVGKAPDTLLKELVVPGLDLRGLHADRPRMGLRVSAHLKNRPIAEQRSLAEQLMPQFLRMGTTFWTPMMSRTEVRQVAAVHDIGAHSYSHASMEFETEQFFENDLSSCWDYFIRTLQVNPHAYAFPNGSYRRGQVESALNSGFRHALLVGNAFSQSVGNVHPRFGIYGDSLREILYRAHGGSQRTTASDELTR